jgi:hypothetical protein
MSITVAARRCFDGGVMTEQDSKCDAIGEAGELGETEFMEQIDETYHTQICGCGPRD